MRFTDNQKKAIESTKKLVVVNSSAGTGKTTVLSHRILHFIKQGWNISDFLALTFTNNAATEMKSRVEKLLRNEVQKAISEDKRKHLKKQLELLPSAHISTFHSFCKRMIEENFSILNVSPVMNIISENQYAKLIEESINEVFEFMMKDKKNYPELYHYYKHSSNPNFIGSMIKFLNLISYNEKNLDIYLENNLALYDTPTDEYMSQEYLRLLKESKLIEHMELLWGKFSPFVNKDKYDYSSLVKFCVDFMYQDNAVKEIRKHISTPYNNETFLKSVYYCLRVKDAKPYMKDIQNSIKWVYMFVKKLKSVVVRKKGLLGMKTFDDLILSFLKMIDNENFLENAIDKKFKEIMIDEFQDTSDYQFSFIEKITHPRLFIVGDKKQSIFRFQGARPELFERLMNQARMRSNGEVINLDQNFRSNNSILSFVNECFSSIANELNSNHFRYDDNDSFKLPETIENNDSIFEIFSEPKEKEYKDLLEMSFITINRYMSMHGDYKFSDFLILSPTNLDFLEVRQIAASYKVPIKITSKSPIAISPLVSLTFNLFRLIENEFDDDSLIALLLHFFSFSEEELTKIKVCFNRNNKGQKTLTTSFYNVLIFYTKNGEDIGISQKIANAIEWLRKISYRYRTMSLRNFVSLLFNDLGFLQRCIEQGNEEAAIQWYQRILDAVGTIDQQGEKSISSLISEISGNDETLLNKAEVSVSSSSNAVRIMTCHKSKGLESKVVFFLNKSGSLSNTITIDPMEGIHLDYDAPDENLKIRVPQRHLLEYKERGLLLTDAIRLLYVVFTRAKERLIIVSPRRTDDGKSKSKIISTRKGVDVRITNSKVKNRHIILKTRIEQIIDYLATYSTIWNTSVKGWAELCSKPLGKDEENIVEGKSIKELETEVLNVIHKSLIGQKIEKRKTKEKRIISLSEIFEDRENQGTDYGTRVHKYFESHFLYQKKEKSPALEKIVNVFLQNNNVKFILDRAQQVLPEVPVLYLNNNRIMTRGIIDLLVVCKDEVVIIDYKTDNVEDTSILIERYSAQLNAYREAVNKKAQKIKVFIYSTHYDELIEIKQ